MGDKIGGENKNIMVKKKIKCMNSIYTNLEQEVKQIIMV